MKASFRHFLKDRRANSATEFAFIFPVMLLFIAGIVEFGRLFLAYNEVDRLATRYASAYSDCNDTPTQTDPTPCNTEIGWYVTPAALKNMAPQLTNTASLVVRMSEVQYSSSGASVVYSTGTPPTAAELQAAQSTIYPPGTLNPQIGVIVIVTYQHVISFFPNLIQTFVPANKLLISYTIAQRKT